MVPMRSGAPAKSAPEKYRFPVRFRLAKKKREEAGDGGRQQAGEEKQQQTCPDVVAEEGEGGGGWISSACDRGRGEDRRLGPVTEDGKTSSDREVVTPA